MLSEKFTKTGFSSRPRKEIRHFFHRTETFSLILELRYDREGNVETNTVYSVEKDKVELKLYTFDLDGSVKNSSSDENA